MKKVLSILYCFWGVLLWAQTSTYTFEALDSLQKIEPKPVVVFIHTDWCKVCDLMDHSAIQTKKVAKILNESFYYVPLNAEDKNPITFNNHTFKFKYTGATTGVHELAVSLALMDDGLAYPTLTILNTENEIIFQHNSLLTKRELTTIFTKILATW